MSEKIDIRLTLEPGDELYDQLKSVMDMLGIKKNTEAARVAIKLGCETLKMNILSQ